MPLVLHIYEAFCSHEDDDTYDAAVLQFIIQGSHTHFYIYAIKHPNFPLPASFEPLRPSIDSVHCIILEIDVNKPSLDIFLPHSPKTICQNSHSTLYYSARVFQLKYPKMLCNQVLWRS